MPQGVIQLAYIGPQDKYLTGDPQMSYFVSAYKRSTKFAIESVRQYFIGGADFGKTSDVLLEKIGDLCSAMYLQIKLPDLNNLIPNKPSDEIYGYINAIGHALIESYEIHIGNQIIDKQYGYWLEIWTSLTTSSGKEQAYFTMVGKFPPLLFNASSNARPLNLYIPLQFWFNTNIGLALPLISLQRQAVKLRFTFRDYRQCWTSNVESFPTLDFNPFPNGIHFDSAFLWVDMIYLDQEERRLFAETPHQYVIEQVQINHLSLNQDQIDHNVQMTFNHPIKELFWVFQNKETFFYAPNKNPNFFNFTDQPIQTSIKAIDPMDSCKIKFENIDRFEERESFYFTTILPFQYHTRVPTNLIHIYSFSIYPEKSEPSGTCNFSRIDSSVIYVKMKQDLPPLDIIIFAKNYNFLIITGGLGGILFK